MIGSRGVGVCVPDKSNCFLMPTFIPQNAHRGGWFYCRIVYRKRDGYDSKYYRGEGAPF